MSDQIFGMFTFSIETGLMSDLREKSRQIEIRLKPMCTVNGEMRRSKKGQNGVGAAEVIQEITRPPLRQTRFISWATAIDPVRR